MNVLSFIHIHRLPSPTGVGRVIDRLLSAHATLYPLTQHRMLVEGKLYDREYRRLSDHWKMASFIPYKRATFWAQTRWIWRQKPLAEDYWDEVDIVYCPAESYVPTHKARLICTIHDVAGFENDLYPDSIGRRWHCLKWNFLFRQFERHADAVVTVSHFSAARIAHYFPALENKLRVIHNAPHPIFGSTVDDKLDQLVECLSGGLPFILVPGGLSLRKNAKVIIESTPLLLKRHPDLRLIIAGKNDPPYVDWITSIDTSRVVLAGYVSDELLNALYRRAAVVWFPSCYEGFGMPVVEAMAAGAPVVASNAASMPEVAGEAALLCDRNSVRAHVDAISSILKSSALRSDLVAKSKVQNLKYSWSKAARHLNDLFLSL